MGVAVSTDTTDAEHRDGTAPSSTTPLAYVNGNDGTFPATILYNYIICSSHLNRELCAHEEDVHADALPRSLPPHVYFGCFRSPFPPGVCNGGGTLTIDAGGAKAGSGDNYHHGNGTGTGAGNDHEVLAAFDPSFPEAWHDDFHGFDINRDGKVELWEVRERLALLGSGEGDKTDDELRELIAAYNTEDRDGTCYPSCATC